MVSTNVTCMQFKVRHCGGTNLQYGWFRNSRIPGRAQDLFRMAEVK